MNLIFAVAPAGAGTQAGGNDAVDFVAILRDFGLPTAILVAVFVGLWRVLTWTANHVVKPIVAAHTGLIEELRKTTVAQQETLTKIAEAQRELLNVTKAQTGQLADIAKSGQEQNALLVQQGEWMAAQQPAAGPVHPQPPRPKK